MIHTRQHPRDGQDLVDRIRKITDKPIKWVVNTHFHGDHHLGSPAFKAIGTTIVAQKDTAALMQKTFTKEIGRRGKFFQSCGYDPSEVKLVLPDVTFDSSMTIRLGGKEIQLLYLGPGQNPGDTFVLIPHDRAIYTPGAFAKTKLGKHRIHAIGRKLDQVTQSSRRHRRRSGFTGPRRRRNTRRRRRDGKVPRR